MHWITITPDKIALFVSNLSPVTTTPSRGCWLFSNVYTSTMHLLCKIHNPDCILSQFTTMHQNHITPWRHWLFSDFDSTFCYWGFVLWYTLNSQPWAHFHLWVEKMSQRLWGHRTTPLYRVYFLTLCYQLHFLYILVFLLSPLRTREEPETFPLAAPGPPIIM